MPEHQYRENFYPKYMKAFGHDVFVLTSDIYYPFGDSFKQRRRKIIELSQFDPEYVIREKVIFSFHDIVYFKYKDVIKNINPDIVHIFEARQLVTYLVAKFCFKCGIPVVYEHEQRSNGISLKTKLRNLLTSERWIKKTVNFSKMVRVLNPESINYLKRINANLDGKFIDMATLGFEPEVFNYNENYRQIYRKSIGLKNNDILVVTSGKNLGLKKVDIIINAVEKIRDIGIKNIYLLLVGTNKRKKFHSKDYIIHKPLVNKEKLAMIFNAADIVTWTRYTVSYFQALGCGSVILVPKTDYTEFLIKKMPKGIFTFDIKYSEDNYLYFEKEDLLVNKIANSLITIVRNQLYEVNKKSLSNLAKSIFSWEVLTRSLEKSYHRVIHDLENENFI